MPHCDVDAIARELARLGKLGKDMPPAWDGAKVRHIVKSPISGKYIGYLLPGRGYMPDLDLKYLGIQKQIPHVYERTLYSRLHDFLLNPMKTYNEQTGQVLDPERGAILTYDGIINARANGKGNDWWVQKNSLTTTSADWHTMERLAGMPSAMTLNTSTAPTQTACDRSTSGAFSFGAINPGGSDKKYLLTFGWVASQQINCGILIDVHVQSGAHRLTVGTAETVSSPVTITRQYYSPLGAGCYMIAVSTTGASATATDLTVTYTNQSGTGGQTTTITGPATATGAEQLWPDSSSANDGGPFLKLATDDYGVRQLSSTTSSVALAAGVLNLQIVTPLIVMPGIAAVSYVERDSTVQIDGLAELVTVSQVIGCLNLLVLPNTTSTGSIGCFIRTCAG